ncbi:DUF1413 domain-containing protein [Vibrio owensii]|uniref:DUF1413 domain-containing protein n=1 Tax=Vibrio owensii TaxID=696485 RepID=UPI003CE58040
MRKKISITLEHDVIARLDAEASKAGQTRQELVEGIINEQANDFALTEVCNTIPLTKEELETRIEDYFRSSGKAEVSFKQLLTHAEWSQFTSVQKRGFGKEFKQMVETNELRAIRIGRKKSDNEQQYSLTLDGLISLMENDKTFSVSSQQCDSLIFDLVRRGANNVPSQYIEDVEQLISLALIGQPESAADTFLEELRERINEA